MHGRFHYRIQLPFEKASMQPVDHVALLHKHCKLILIALMLSLVGTLM